MQSNYAVQATICPGQVKPHNVNRMSTMAENNRLLRERYTTSGSCSCPVCVSFCRRPGWWTVEEASMAIKAGLAFRMMLEVSPDQRFGVLSPAFKGNECNYSYQLFSAQGCTFLSGGNCELHETGYQPLECRFCHHDRMGLGIHCHHDIEDDWNTVYGKRLIIRWGNLTDFWKRQGLIVVEK